ncbi:MAG TPA: hypothetical protein VGA36_12090 [Nitriliruptorales bacterium]
MLVATNEGVIASDGEVVLEGEARQVARGDGRWLSVVDGRAYRSPDRASWEPAADAVEQEPTVVRDVGGSLLVGTAGGHLWVVDPDGDARELAAFRQADTFEDWHTPWGGPPDVRSMTVTAAGTWLVNVHVGGILRSTDQGRTWQPTIDLHTDVHEVLAAGARVYAALGAGGLATTDDDGRTWRIEAAGLPDTYCRAVTVAGDRVLVSSSRGPGGGGAAVHARTVGSRDGLRRLGLPDDLGGNVDTGCLVARGLDVAVGTADGRLFVSDDAGMSWRLRRDGLGTIRSLSW